MPVFQGLGSQLALLIVLYVLGHKHHAQTGVSSGKLRICQQGLLVLFYRLGVLALAIQAVSVAFVGQGETLVDLARLLEAALTGSLAFLLEIRGAQIQQHHRLGAVAFQRLLKCPDRLVVFALHIVGNAQV